MKILALEKETPGNTAEQYAPHLRAEAARVWELYQIGVLRELYFHRERHTAVLMLECASVDEAKIILESMPLYIAGLIDFELIPLIPYDGFARLFEKYPQSAE
jgi:hypothetical protein